jgi:biotin carboxyl carrier protein
MTRQVLVDGRPGTLAMEGDRVLYTRSDGGSFEGSFSLTATGPGEYSVVLGRSVFRVTLGRDGEMLVAGRAVRVEIFDPRDRAQGVVRAIGGGSQQVTAPMPGKIVRVLAAAGDSVEEGQDLLVVEAMKMQNSLKSPKAGRVAELRAREGATVAAGEVLAVVE